MEPSGKCILECRRTFRWLPSESAERKGWLAGPDLLEVEALVSEPEPLPIETPCGSRRAMDVLDEGAPAAPRCQFGTNRVRVAGRGRDVRGVRGAERGI